MHGTAYGPGGAGARRLRRDPDGAGRRQRVEEGRPRRVRRPRPRSQMQTPQGTQCARLPPRSPARPDPPGASAGPGARRTGSSSQAPIAFLDPTCSVRASHAALITATLGPTVPTIRSRVVVTAVPLATRRVALDMSLIDRSREASARIVDKALDDAVTKCVTRYGILTRQLDTHCSDSVRLALLSLASFPRGGALCGKCLARLL
jgi:hypothetical protein